MTKESLTLRLLPGRGVVVGLEDSWDMEDFEKWRDIGAGLATAAFGKRNVCIAAWVDGHDFIRRRMSQVKAREVKVGRWPKSGRLRVACLEFAEDQILRDAALDDQFGRGELVLVAGLDIAPEELARVLQSDHPQDDWGMPVTKAELISVTGVDYHVAWINPRLESTAIRDLVQRLAAPLPVREVND